MKPDAIMVSPAYFKAWREFVWWQETLYSPAGLMRLFPALRGKR
jgi:hypothetical protein